MSNRGLESDAKTPKTSSFGEIYWRNGSFEHFVKWFDECRVRGVFPDDYTVSFKIQQPREPKASRKYR